MRHGQWHFGLLVMCVVGILVGGCGGGGTVGGTTGGAGAPVVNGPSPEFAVLGASTRSITLPVGRKSYRVDTHAPGTNTSATRTTPVTIGSTTYPLASAAQTFLQGNLRSAVSGNPALVTVSVQAGNVLQIAALKPGRSILHVYDELGGEVCVGVRIRRADGSLPDLAGINGQAGSVAIGAPFRNDPATDLPFYQETAIDMVCAGLNGGFHNPVSGADLGWYDQYPGNGEKLSRLLRATTDLGMVQTFVYSQIPGDGLVEPSAKQDYANMQSATFMKAYFGDLVAALQLAQAASNGDRVVFIFEPDLIAYMMVYYSGTDFATGPEAISALASAARTATDLSGNAILGANEVIPGVTRGSDDNLRAFVLTVNYLATKYCPNATFGWAVDHWASSSVSRTSAPWWGSLSLMHITDLYPSDIATARAKLITEADLVAAFYKKAGIIENGASFMAVEKFAFDGGSRSFTPTAPKGWMDPAGSAWFWDTIHLDNFLAFVKELHVSTGLPVVLWQLPAGHINHSLNQSAFAWPSMVAGGEFPDLLNAPAPAIGYGSWEDSTPTYFFGDQFRVDTSNERGLTSTQVTDRLRFFGRDDPCAGYSGAVSVRGNIVTWQEHISKAREAGVIALLFGSEYGETTSITPYGGMPANPEDHYWWIDKAHKYLLNPVPIP